MSSSTPHKPKEFPPELREIVLDLVNDDRRTLSSCSRVSKSWLTPSQSRLFGTIQLSHRDKDPGQDFRNFHAFLRSNTHFCTYPRTLLLWGTSYDDPSLKLSSLVSLLRLLPRLQTLRLDSGVFIGSPIPTLRDCELLTLDRLIIECFERIDNDSLHDLFNPLNLFSDVRTLEISSVFGEVELLRGGDMEYNFAGYNLPFRLRVRGLKIRSENWPKVPFIELIRKTASMEVISHLDLRCHYMEEISSFASLVKDAGPTITSIKTNVMGGVQRGMPGDEFERWKRSVSALAGCASLTDLSLRVRMDGPPSPSQSDLSTGTRMLYMMRYVSPTVKRIKLKFEGPILDVDFLTRSMDWDRLDRILRDLPQLTSVVISFMNARVSPEGIDEINKAQLLPLNLSRGVLQPFRFRSSYK